MNKFCLIFSLLFLIHTSAQQSGIVYYKYTYNEKQNNKSKNNLQNQASSFDAYFANYAKNHQYILKFNPDESYYYVEAAMKPDDIDSRSYEMSKIKFGKGIFYQNAKARYTLNQKNVLGKLYLIKDTLDKTWKIGIQHKMIAGYKTYKATRLNHLKQTITAWFTPEIPLPFGPAGNGGLPGLILELDYLNNVLRIDKIVFQNQPIKVEKPVKGIQITEDEFRKGSKQRRLEIYQKLKRKYNK